MKSAEQVLKNRKMKMEESRKEIQDRINLELMLFEKSLNKYENNIKDIHTYITVEAIIKTKEVKELLRQNGYHIDCLSNDIAYGTTRVYLNRSDYDMAVNQLRKPLSYVKDRKDNKIPYIKKERNNIEMENEDKQNCNSTDFLLSEMINQILGVSNVKQNI